MTQVIKARPTLYKGIQMRSRLEADYAAHLDRTAQQWEYEPRCFAGSDGQWLPDFSVTHPDGGKTYVELKPDYLLERKDGESQEQHADRIDELVTRMKVTWDSEPDVWLELVFWAYGDSGPVFTILGHPTRPWMAFPACPLMLPLIWIGMDQLVPLMRGLPAFRKEAS